MRRDVPWVRVVRERTTSYEARPRCGTPGDVARLVLAEHADGVTESMWVVCLDATCRAVAVAEVAKGGVGAVATSVADIFRPAIAVGAHAVVLAHNHPSGDPTPSAEDRAMTTKVREGGELLGVPLLDHVVLTSGGGWHSFADEGELQPASASEQGA